MATNKREPSVYSETVAATIRGLRAIANRTQAEVYEAAGLSRSTYIRIESGSHVTDVSEIARICAVYEIGLAEFFHRVEANLARTQS